MSYKIVKFSFLFFASFFFLSASSQSISSWKNEFEYNLEEGTYSIFSNGNEIVTDAISYVVFDNGTIFRSNDQDLKRSSSVEEFVDELGKGEVFTYQNKNNNGVILKQLFYVYESESFIIMEIEIEGDGLQTNTMVPMFSDKAIEMRSKLWHQVIVPFDNDEFISYKNVPLSNKSEVFSSEVGILIDQNSSEGFIIASLDQSLWKSGVSFLGYENVYNEVKVLSGFTDRSLTHDAMKHGTVEGDKISSGKYLIDYSENWRTSIESFGKTHRVFSENYIRKWEDGTPFGWNSWGVIQEKINYDKSISVVDYFKNQIPYFRNENKEAFIDLDSFWDNMTPGGMTGDYSVLKEFVEYCKDNNLRPGIYWAPFTDWGHGQGPNRKVEGSDYTFGDIWTEVKGGYHDLDGGRAIDPTHPGTLKRMEYILNRLIESGFEMIKIDFLSHGAIESKGFYNENIYTGMQSFEFGMKHLVRTLNNKMLIYAAISPSLATSRFAHVRRVACDAWNTIEQTKYTLNSLSFGWWQTYIYDYIDADHLVFENEPLEVNEARLLSGIITGPLILGDDFSLKQEWQSKMNTYLQDPEILNVVNDGKSFRPIGFVKNDDASNLYVKKTEEYTYIAVFNFKDDYLSVKMDFDLIGLQNNIQYNAVELFKKKTEPLNHKRNIVFNGIGAKLFKIKNN